MYKCNECNKIFDEPISQSAESFYGVSDLFSYGCGEVVKMCPYCQETSFEEYREEPDGLLEILDNKGEYMKEVLDNLKCDVYNGEKCYCMTSEEMLNAIKELSKKEEQELQKYKSLYENEKEHTDTLKRIIKKIEEYIKNIDEEEFVNTEHYVEILDLLKEIK